MSDGVRDETGMSVMSETPVRLSFDRGTLLLDGLSNADVAKIFDKGLWTWDRRVHRWRCNALKYAEVRDALQNIPSPSFMDSVPQPPTVK